MRTSSASGASAQSDLLALLHIVAFLDRKFRQMQIECQQSLAVVDDNAIAFKEQRPRQDDTPVIYGFDRGATGHAEIEPLMSALYGAVKNTLDSKHVGDLGIHRS